MRRSATRIARLGALICVLTGMAACSSVQTYPGAARPSAEIAILESGSRGRMLEIDGRAYTSGNTFALLPGEHALRFKLVVKAEDLIPEMCPAGGCTGVYGQTTLRMTEICDAALVAEPGRRYRIVLDVGQTKRKHTLQGTGIRPQLGKAIIDVATQQSVGSIGPCEWEDMKL